MTERHRNLHLRSLIEEVPWGEIFLGLFIPLNILYFFLHPENRLLGAAVTFVCGGLYLLVRYKVKKELAALPFMFLSLLLLAFFSYFRKEQPVLYLLVEAFSYAVTGGLFLGSLLINRPFIHFFIPEEKLEEIPEKIRESSHYVKAWKILTATWGVTLILSGVITVYASAASLSQPQALSHLTGWPLIVLLFILNSVFPACYWRLRADEIEKEHEERNKSSQ